MTPCSKVRAPITALTSLFLLTAGVSGAETSWRGWGGPNGDFTLPAAPIAASWPEAGPTELWSRDLGPGHSSILVEDGHLYTVYHRGDEDVAVAMSASDGETKWERAYPAAPRTAQATDYGSGPHAAPLLIGDRMITITAAAVVHAFDKRNGEPAWSHDLVEEYGTKVPHFGYAVAPIGHAGRVLVLTGGKHGVVGFDPKTGDQTWASEALPISYATPLVTEIGGEQQIVFMTPSEVVGVAFSDGAVRWRHPHKNQWDTNCVGPWLGDDGLLFLSTMGEAGSRALRIKKEGNTTTVEEISASRKCKVSHTTALLRGDHFYGSSGEYLMAYEVATGEIAWREKGYKNTSLVAIGDRILALREDGTLSLVSLGPDGVETHASHQLLAKPAWTAPTVVGTKLYVRDQARLVALDLAGRRPATRPTRN